MASLPGTQLFTETKRVSTHRLSCINHALQTCCKPTATGAAPNTFKTHPGHFPLQLHGAKRAAASFAQPSCEAVTNYMR